MAKTYNTVPDKAAGDTFTEAMWDTYIRDNGNNLIVPASCRVTQSSGTSLSAATETTVAFAAEGHDNDSMHDTVTNNSRITIQTTGLYVVSAMVGTTVVTDYLYGAIRLNGSTYLARNSDAVSGAPLSLTVTTVYPLTAGDYVELRAYQNNSGSSSRTTDTALTWMSAVWIGKTS